MKKLLLVTNLITIAICIYAFSSREQKVFKKVVNYSFVVKHKEEKLTLDNARKFIEKINVRFPDVVLAQCIIESGNFQSNLSKTNNNLLGMKQPGQRPTMSFEPKRGYANFDTWKHCIIDYAFWQARYVRNCNTEDEYLDYLARNYASDKNYRNKIISVINEFRKEK
jgi:uncharacterized FlgJ-related protein